MTSSLLDCPEIVQLAAKDAISKLLFLPGVPERRRLDCMYATIEGLKQAHERALQRKEMERIQKIRAYIAQRNLRETSNDA